MDNCPDNGNPGQEDTDSDGIGDACDDPGAGGGGAGGVGGDPGLGGEPSAGGNPGVGGSSSSDGGADPTDDDGDRVIESGCGCRVVGSREPSSNVAWLAILGAAAVGLRRRR